MWSQSYSRKVRGINVADIWQVWIDVNQWHTWHDDIEYAKLIGNKVMVGSKFILKPKNGPKVNIEFIQIDVNKSFTDLTRFPLAKMYGKHEFIPHANGELEIKTTMSVTGLLSFVWQKLVAEKIASDEEQQTDRLIERVKLLTQHK